MTHIPELALTFDDVLLVPGYSEHRPSQVDTASSLTQALKLRIPLVSAAMDTVTEAPLAIALAQLGGIGVIHKSMSAAAQAAQVKQVKKYESGVVADPITITQDSKIVTLMELAQRHAISGLPVVDPKDGSLVGIVTNRDRRFVTDTNESIASIMTPFDKLVTLPDDEPIEQAQRLMHQHRIEKVIVVDSHNPKQLKGLITVKDIQRREDFPLASKDARGQLQVAAAIGTGDSALKRAELLLQAGTDALVIDTAHGHSHGVLHTMSELRQAYPRLQIIVGNIATAEAAAELADKGANAVKVGIGPGSICTTRIVAGVGVPQISAIQSVAAALKGSEVCIIADGGIRYSGDIAKAIAAGAHSVMIGGLFAGTEEAPGEIELYQGRAYKNYRGMGSLGAMHEGSADRYYQQEQSSNKLVPEGIEGRVPAKGPLRGVVQQLVGGLRSSLGYTGNTTIDAMRSNCKMIRITTAGIRESHVHDVQIVREAPNYHI